MKNLKHAFLPTKITLSVAICLSATPVFADEVTNWNYYSVLATKAATSLTTGNAGNALNSNVATRIEAIEARAVYDAVNAINHFSNDSYYYTNTSTLSGLTSISASVAAAQAAHDVLKASLPTTGTWPATLTWLDTQLASDLTALGASSSDAGIAVGQAAAAAALAARSADYSKVRTTYTPSSNLSVNAANAVVANATGNPGVGLWRPSNGAAGVIDPITGAPTGFDATGNIQAAAAIDFNWKNVTPFSISTFEKQKLVAAVPAALQVGSAEYTQEVSFVQNHGEDSSNPGSRSNDQLLQALYYKQDAELHINEAARLASAAHNLGLNQNAKLFAALDNALADSRIATWQAKYDLDFWRPITAINADANGNVASYNWKPLGVTPAHPSSPAGHSATVAAGAEILRAFFNSDSILPNNSPVTLTSIPWLIGTNNGTGQLATAINGQDSTTRNVSSFSQIQLENGQSRLYLGVHFGNDNFQGQTLGLSIADQIINAQLDPAAHGLRIFKGNNSVANGINLHRILVNDSANSGFFGL
ncbi:vanadium-dependent haloperoxidase [Methylomonas sp. AM2-LC]|uniref:vanadium-dependent haloperoxidase n=1 Tax=Methylomonas sp. AM2-LC TaxID=3153301 RepID=UPI00326516EA